MDFPVKCTFCNHEKMVDFEKIETKPISSVISARGYVCEKCGNWVSFWCTTKQMDENLKKLDDMNPAHTSFPYLFGKAYRRAQDLQRRGAQING